MTSGRTLLNKTSWMIPLTDWWKAVNSPVLLPPTVSSIQLSPYPVSRLPFFLLPSGIPVGSLPVPCNISSYHPFYETSLLTFPSSSHRLSGFTSPPVIKWKLQLEELQQKTAEGMLMASCSHAGALTSSHFIFPIQVKKISSQKNTQSAWVHSAQRSPGSTELW